MRRGVVMHAVVGRRERHGGDVQHAHAVRLGPCAARRQQLGHLGGGTALPPPTPLPEPRLILDLSRLFLFHRARACYWKASDTMARISALEDYVTDSWSESILLKYQPELETCGSMGSLANQCAEACFGSSCVAVCCPVGFQLTLLPQVRPQATIPVPVRLGYHQPLPPRPVGAGHASEGCRCAWERRDRQTATSDSESGATATRVSWRRGSGCNFTETLTLSPTSARARRVTGRGRDKRYSRVRSLARRAQPELPQMRCVAAAVGPAPSNSHGRRTIAAPD